MKRLLGSKESLAYAASPGKLSFLTALAVLLVGCGGGGDDGPVVTTGTPAADAEVVTIDDLICDTIIVLLGGDCDAPPPNECDALANALSVACLTEPDTVVVDSGPWPNPPSGITVSEPSGLTVTLDWIPPTEYTDGTTLSAFEGYSILWTMFPEENWFTTAAHVTLHNPGLSAYVLDLPAPGVWYIKMSTFANGGKGGPSSVTVSVEVLP